MKKIVIILVVLVHLMPLYAFKIYDKNDLKVKVDTEFKTTYEYEACDFPGITGFQDPSAEVTLDMEYLDNLNLNFSYDFGSEELNDAYMQYSFFDPLRIKVGKFKVHYGAEQISGLRPQTIHSDASDNFTPGRSTGISIYGKNLFNFLDYNFAFTNDYDSEEDNDTGQHVFTLMVDKDISLGESYKLTPGYNILYNTEETFSQGCFLELSHDKDTKLHILLEYMEQRYYNFFWNRSVYLSSSYRFSLLEPFLHTEYYDDYVGEDTDDDAFTSGLGLNFYQLNDSIKFTLSYVNKYLYTKDSTSSDPVMYHTFTLETEIKL